MNYRKKPIVIEAVQVCYAELSEDPALFKEMPEWLDAALQRGDLILVRSTEDYWYLDVKTLEGNMRMGPEDWLIRGVNGELYPCKNEIFKLTYDLV